MKNTSCGCVQVIRRLRERGEPISLFGESDYDAFQRLRKIEFQAPEVNKVRPSSPLAIFTLMSYSVYLFTRRKKRISQQETFCQDGLVLNLTIFKAYHVCL